MKIFNSALCYLFVVMALISCKDNNPQVVELPNSNMEIAKVENDPNATYTKVEFGIEGMSCEMGCAKTIEKKLAKMDGVKSAKVDFKKEMAMVEYNEAKVTHLDLKETVTKVGKVYKVKDIKEVDMFSQSE